MAINLNLSNLNKTASYTSFAHAMMSRLDEYISNNDLENIKINNLKYPIFYVKDDKTNKYTKRDECDITICDEPATFYNEIEQADNPIAAFENKICEFKKIHVKKPSNNIWINRSVNGINLRIGDFDNDNCKQNPIVLGDENVHGVIVGRTGAGKSNLLNNIILNLITEYAPWELDLYLVDMKKVELSRYMDIDEITKRYLTPHVVTLGATSEVRYVVSMISRIEEYMQMRQNLLQKLGCRKLQDFIDKYQKYNLCLPRILLLVDEFQQLLSENCATSKERNILSNKISSITKLGRATGVHMLLASQEMSGALSGKDLGNFKVRIALPCDSAVSLDILGNDAASKTKIGTTLVNTNGGSAAEDNLTYKTPFIDDKKKATKDENGSDDSDFELYLKNIFSETHNVDWTKVQKFYQEGNYPKKEYLQKIVSNKKIQKNINDIKKNNLAIIESSILGSPVVFNLKKNDFDYVFIESGRKRNIAVISQSDAIIGNFLKVLIENLKYSNNYYTHNVFYESETIRSIYPTIIDDLNDNKSNNPPIVKELNIDEYDFATKKGINEILSTINFNNEFSTCIKNFINAYIVNVDDSVCKEIVDTNGIDIKYSKNNLVNIVNELINTFNINSSSYNDAIVEIVEELKKIHSQYSDQLSKEDKDERVKDKYGYIVVIIRVLQRINPQSKQYIFGDKNLFSIFDESFKNKKYTNNNFIINWIIGTDNVDKNFDKLLSKKMEDSTKHNEFFVLVGNDIETLEQSYKNCNYIFMNTNNDKLYDKMKLDFSKHADDNKNIDCKIVNYNKQFTFKPFDFDMKKYETPQIDFNEVNLNET
ncbi:MAG: hypothetical protein J6M39_05045 [Lachnospiraceae bacterium]|nr:hypothetical protein [Lachnospiraceae bacterium]